MGKHFVALLAVLSLLLLHAPAAIGQGDPAQPGQPSLAGQVVDPTASIKTFTLRSTFAPSLWGIDDHENQFDARVGIPHDGFGMSQIARLTIPYVTSAHSGIRGLGDVELLNIILYPSRWGTIAGGGVLRLGTNKGPGFNTLSVGPALGLVHKKEKWTYGLFNQNFFSFGDIATTQLQPILAYTVNDRMSVAIGDAQWTVDWKKGRFVNVPLSGELNFIAHIQKQPMRFFVNPQYNVVNETGTRKWIISLGAALIVK